MKAESNAQCSACSRACCRELVTSGTSVQGRAPPAAGAAGISGLRRLAISVSAANLCSICPKRSLVSAIFPYFPVAGLLGITAAAALDLVTADSDDSISWALSRFSNGTVWLVPAGLTTNAWAYFALCVAVIADALCAREPAEYGLRLVSRRMAGLHNHRSRS
jgi:hypothetical protein